MKKTFLMLQSSALRSTVVQYKSWHAGADMRVHIFESSQLEGSCVRGLLYSR